jgi:hypothetical protein
MGKREYRFRGDRYLQRILVVEDSRSASNA